MPRTLHLRLALSSIMLLALAGCGSYGGGSGGGNGVSLAAPLSATLGWTDASGPVASYRVFVLRNGVPDAAAQMDVSTPRVTVSGTAGDRLRIQVAAQDSMGNFGPGSDVSPEITLTTDGPVISAAATIDPVVSGGAAETRQTAGAGPGPDAVATTSSPAENGDTADATQGDGTDAAADAGNELLALLEGGASGLLLWEADAPSLDLRLTSLSGDALRTELSFERPADDWSVVGAADFDADGLRDVLWESGDGVLAFSSLAKLAGSAPVAPLVLLGRLEADEIVISTADFDGDGHTDLLVRDEAADANSVWWGDGVGTPEVEALAGDLAGSRLEASGDFDGDGRDDLLWRRADGTLLVHFMAGAASEASLELADSATLAAVASGDVDGDGDDDLIVRDAAGRSSVLRMQARLAPTPWQHDAADVPGWELADLSDLDGDGVADLVWGSGTRTAADWMIGFQSEGTAEYVPVEPGAGWMLVSFAR